MNPEATMPFIIPPDLVARLEEVAQEAGKSPSEMLQGWIERDRKERSWQALMRRGQLYGAAVAIPDDEEGVNNLVNAKIAESRAERRGR